MYRIHPIFQKALLTQGSWKEDDAHTDRKTLKPTSLPKVTSAFIGFVCWSHSPIHRRHQRLHSREVVAVVPGFATCVGFRLDIVRWLSVEFILLCRLAGLVSFVAGKLHEFRPHEPDWESNGLRSFLAEGSPAYRIATCSQTSSSTMPRLVLWRKGGLN